MKKYTHGLIVGKTVAVLLTLLLVFGTSQTSRACSPLSVPSLLSQNISGGNLNLNWQSNTIYNCTYSVQVEITCMGSAFTGTNPATLFMSPQLVKPSSAPAPFPAQAINISNLCPGTVYQFRAREQYGTATFSGWTSTFTFTTPGTFTQPVANIAASSNTICPPQTSSLNVTVNNVCGLTAPSFSWIPSNGLSCTTCSNPVASPTVSTNYTCIVTGGVLGCWTASSVVAINISSGNAILNVAADQSSCINSIPSATLNASGSASVQTSVSWSPAPGSISSNSLVATNLSVGVTTITVYDVNGCKATTTVNILPAPPPVTFAINYASGTQSITCQNPSITMSTTTTYTYGTINYTWTSTSFSATGPGTTLNSQGNYQVCGMDPATSCSMCATFTVGQSITPPTTSVNPITQVISCTASAVTFTGTCTSPSINVMQNWYTPFVPPPGPPAASTNGTNSPFIASAGPGTYSCIVTDLTNGCTTTKTVEVTTIAGFPTFSLTSANNFSVGCSPNTTTVFVVNPITTGPAQFAYLPPTFTGTNIAYGAFSSSVLATPGTWTISVLDPVNGCHTDVPVIILQNTVQPHASASLLTETLTCFNPTVLATGTSTTPGTVISWNVPSTPPTLPSATVVVGPPVGPPTGTNTMAYPDYTIVVTNTVNGCITTSVVPINQNFLPPKPALAAISTPPFINCLKNPGGGAVPVVISFTNNPIQSGIVGAVPIVTSWMGPSPSPTTSGVATYSAYVAGDYTITVQDSKNGCVGIMTKTIMDMTQPPVLSNSINAIVDCAANAATLTPQVVGGNTGYTFLFLDFPHNAQFNPLNATQQPNGTTASTILVSEPGNYGYIITNTLTGCTSTSSFVVAPGNINANFTTEPATGYAPLNVNFTNNSASSLNSSGITSIWSYGNGSIQTTTSNIITSTTFSAAGTYTVMLIVAKGSCVDTAYQVIKVEIPSKLEVPNVFTPNGDGSNDVFFLKTQNLTEIECIIYDRWGNKVYEVTSTTGNIAWDGKNQEGKECAAGVYFYLIKATGKDNKTYDQKGNVSLYR